MVESTLSPVYGLVIALAGVALAVLVASVLYKHRDEKQEDVSREKPFRIHEAKSAEETGC